MTIEERLRDKLRKAEALFAGARTAGERGAAEAAMERLRARLTEAAREEKPIEMKYTLPDMWSVRLFMALCRRYGVRPYRYARQRRTTVMARAPKSFLDQVVWRQFLELHGDLVAYLEETTETLIRETVHRDTTDAEIVPEPLALR